MIGFALANWGSSAVAVAPGSAALLAGTYVLATVYLWYALPLVVSVSLVCAATRHELMGPILQHAVRFATWVVVIMGAFMCVLFLMQSLA